MSVFYSRLARGGEPDGPLRNGSIGIHCGEACDTRPVAIREYPVGVEIRYVRHRSSNSSWRGRGFGMDSDQI